MLARVQVAAPHHPSPGLRSRLPKLITDGGTRGKNRSTPLMAAKSFYLRVPLSFVQAPSPWALRAALDYGPSKLLWPWAMGTLYPKPGDPLCLGHSRPYLQSQACRSAPVMQKAIPCA